MYVLRKKNIKLLEENNNCDLITTCLGPYLHEGLSLKVPVFRNCDSFSSNRARRDTIGTLLRNVQFKYRCCSERSVHIRQATLYWRHNGSM